MPLWWSRAATTTSGGSSITITVIIGFLTASHLVLLLRFFELLHFFALRPHFVTPLFRPTIVRVSDFLFACGWVDHERLAHLIIIYRQAIVCFVWVVDAVGLGEKVLDCIDKIRICWSSFEWGCSHERSLDRFSGAGSHEWQHVTSRQVVPRCRRIAVRGGQNPWLLFFRSCARLLFCRRLFFCCWSILSCRRGRLFSLLCLAVACLRTPCSDVAKSVDVLGIEKAIALPAI